MHALPLYHCAQLDCFLGPDIYFGATSIVLPAPDPSAILKRSSRSVSTKLFCPPTVWIACCAHQRSAKPTFARCARATTAPRRCRSRSCGSSSSGFPAAPVEFLRPDGDGPARDDPRAGRTGQPGRPAGRAALNVETRLVDDADMPVPPGTVGEIVHRSPHATLGYCRDEAMTAEAFRNGWFHSGDLGVMTQDGYLTIVDRKKDMIKTGGENVASREVEETIYQMAESPKSPSSALPTRGGSRRSSP